MFSLSINPFKREARVKPIFEKAPAILVCSSKGGVGKTMLAVAIIREFAKHYNTAALDADLRAPNLVRALGGHDWHVDFNAERRMMANVITERLHVFSSSLQFSSAYGIAWESEKEKMFIESSLFDVDWGFSVADVLVADSEPSGIDPLAILSQAFRGRIGVVVVSSPRTLSIENCERLMLVCTKYNVPVFGVAANMAGSECPKCHADVVCASCGTHYNPFGAPAPVQLLADKYDVPFLGSVRHNPDISKHMDLGEDMMSPDAEAVAKRVVELVEAKYKMKKRC